MTQTHKWRDIKRRDITPEVRAQAREIRHAMEDAVALGQLRKSREVRQVDVAERMGVGQGEVSRLERREDLYLSTLRDYVQALGGELDLVARFPDGHQVLIQAKASESPTIFRNRLDDVPAEGKRVRSTAREAIEEVGRTGSRSAKAAAPKVTS